MTQSGPRTRTFADLTVFYGPTSGGVRTYLTAKRAFLAARGFRHLLLVPGPADEVEDGPDGRTVRLRGPRVPSAPGYRVILRGRRAEAVLLQERPALVEVGDPYTLAWAAFRARARLGGRDGAAVPAPGGAPAPRGPAVVLFVHSDFVDAHLRPLAGPLGAAVGWAYARRVYRSADLVLAPSPAVASRLAAHGIAGVEVMPLGVDTGRFRPSRRSEALRRALGADGRPACLYVGRLSTEKGLGTLLEALPRLAAGGAVVWVAGAGRLARRLADAAGHYPVRLLGFVDDRDRLADLYAAADVVLVPGPHETFGLAVLEGLAAGTPVVAAATGGAAAILTPEAGRLVPPGDPAALAEAALQLAREGRERRADACRRLAEAHAWEPTLARLLARYERLLGGDPAGTGPAHSSSSPPRCPAPSPSGSGEPGMV